MTKVKCRNNSTVEQSEKNKYCLVKSTKKKSSQLVMLFIHAQPPIQKSLNFGEVNQFPPVVNVVLPTE